MRVIGAAFVGVAVIVATSVSVSVVLCPLYPLLSCTYI